MTLVEDPLAKIGEAVLDGTIPFDVAVWWSAEGHRTWYASRNLGLLVWLASTRLGDVLAAFTGHPRRGYYNGQRVVSAGLEHRRVLERDATVYYLSLRFDDESVLSIDLGLVDDGYLLDADSEEVGRLIAEAACDTLRAAVPCPTVAELAELAGVSR